MTLILIFALYGSLAIGFPYDDRLAAFTRVTYTSILGSVILASQWFMTFMKARNEAVNIHVANGRLLKASGDSALLCVIVIGVVAPVATHCYGFIPLSIVYPDSLSTKKIATDAVLVPVAYLLGGLR